MYYRNNRNNRELYVDTSNEQRSLTLKPLRKYTNYSIRVAARTRRGPGQVSKKINVMTDEDSK